MAKDRSGALEAEVARWPAMVAILAVGGLYFFISSRYAVGPRWLVLVVGAAALLPLAASRRAGRHALTHGLALGVDALLTAAVVASVVLLFVRLAEGRAEALPLLRDAGLIWVANVVVFALWYWTIDGGGPARRHPGKHASTDFAFPQQQQDDDGVVEGWSPGFLDYLFLAFTGSSAFGPTDTLILSRPAKALMMTQAAISLLIVVVLAAHAAGAIGGG